MLHFACHPIVSFHLLQLYPPLKNPNTLYRWLLIIHRMKKVKLHAKIDNGKNNSKEAKGYLSINEISSTCHHYPVLAFAFRVIIPLSISSASMTSARCGAAYSGATYTRGLGLGSGYRHIGHALSESISVWSITHRLTSTDRRLMREISEVVSLALLEE